jgi:hypothetical protein
MARLVGWYNAGGFTDEQGKFRSSGHQGSVHVWELWNEPDESSENPCRAAHGAPALRPDEYVALWNTVVPRMLAVDSTIQIVGPATADPRPDYLDALVVGASRAPDALSYHSYGAFDNDAGDRELFDRLDRLVLSPGSVRWPPLWVTELNVNSATDDDSGGRPWGPLGVAWGASAFRILALGGIPLVNQFEFVASAQFGLVDEVTGTPRLPYWRDVLLSRAFPVGSTILQSTTSQPGIDVLAARKPDGGTSVLIVNRQVPSSRDQAGRGLPTSVTLRLSGPLPTAAQLTLLDGAAREPRVVAHPGTAEFNVEFAGYGMALVDLPSIPTPAALNAS